MADIIKCGGIAELGPFVGSLLLPLGALLV